MTIRIKRLTFDRTCKSFPEQYDVYNEKEEMVGYIRLRYGHLTCEYPDVGGEYIYSAFMEDDLAGYFKNEEQRLKYLHIIADKIIEKIEETNGKKV